MSEETTMYQELKAWRTIIGKLESVALEMSSPEQDSSYLTQFIRRLFANYEAIQAEGDDVADCYCIDFEHPDNPNYKLVFEFNVFFTRDDDE